ncbi:contractile injection system tape measure protein [Winogradskyella sp.]|uniref:contractile injection system tape measure protein n=1 Tax=Winogradskyella sp. TaxID=1883156 RepID=UPI0025FDAFEB|nr:contractile injection system tape measure protein [Winogradskyella sp.]
MEEKHCVYKVVWDTSCNEKSLVSKFQEGISIWSQLNLPQILSEVLDTIDTGGETWYIEKIEIDIGSISMESIDNDLTIKVKDELTKQILRSIATNSQKTKPMDAMVTDSLFINNAGLVLISPYFQALFEQLQLTNENQFTNTINQQLATRYLQYVATKNSQSDETQLSLNKILCGLDPKDPVLDGIDMLESEEKLVSEMLQAIITHWSSLGSSSIDGFRGNWLIRDGILVEEDDKWRLTVEKKSYDMLINQCPWAFSIIKFPWMKKPIHVNWPY